MLKIDQLTATGVRNYLNICKQYCDWVEQKDLPGEQAYYQMLLELLPGIYRGNLRLPKVEVRYTHEAERFVSEKQYKTVFRQIGSVTGKRDKFPYISNPHDVDRLLMSEASLAELLADVYLELKDFVSLYSTGTLEDMNDALAENQDTFRQEWGVKVLTALNILHYYYFEASSQLQPTAGSFLPEEAAPEGFDASELEGFSTESEQP